MTYLSGKILPAYLLVVAMEMKYATFKIFFIGPCLVKFLYLKNMVQLINYANQTLI